MRSFLNFDSRKSHHQQFYNGFGDRGFEHDQTMTWFPDVFCRTTWQDLMRSGIQGSNNGRSNRAWPSVAWPTLATSSETATLPNLCRGPSALQIQLARPAGPPAGCTAASGLAGRPAGWPPVVGPPIRQQNTGLAAPPTWQPSHRESQPPGLADPGI